MTVSACKTHGVGMDRLVFPVVVALELFALGGDIHPETAIATY